MQIIKREIRHLVDILVIIVLIFWEGTLHVKKQFSTQKNFFFIIGLNESFTETAFFKDRTI